MRDYFLAFLENESLDSEQAIFINETFHTYGELRGKVLALSAWIRQAGFQKKRIGVVLEDDLGTYAAILAVWHAGGTYVPIHPRYPAERIGKIVMASDMGLVLYVRNLPAGIPSEVLSKSVDSAAVTEQPARADFSPVAYEVDDIVYILFTSGSTGEPKGVQVSYGNLRSFLYNLSELSMDLGPGAGYLQMFELTFDLSIVSILLPLIRRGTLYHVPSNSVKYLEIYRLLEEHPIHFAILVPSVLAMLKPYFSTIRLPRLQVVGLSGEAVPLELTTEWQTCCPEARFFNFYGPTECTIFCTYYRIPRTDIAAKNGIVSIGRPNMDCEALCISDDGSPAAVDQKASLWIGGGQVSPGYVKNEPLNNSLFQIRDGKRFYDTGDIVVRDSSGDLYYLGRKDHQVKINGYRIELSEVEHNANRALNAKAFVIAVSDQRAMMQLVLFTLKTGLTDVAVIEKLKNVLPDYMLPSSVFQLDEFPLNDNGKLDRNKLKSLYESSRPDAS